MLILNILFQLKPIISYFIKLNFPFNHWKLIRIKNVFFKTTLQTQSSILVSTLHNKILGKSCISLKKLVFDWLRISSYY